MNEKLNVTYSENIKETSEKLQSLSESCSKISNQLLCEANSIRKNFLSEQNFLFLNQLEQISMELDSVAKSLNNASEALLNK